MTHDPTDTTSYREILRIGNENYTDGHPRIWTYKNSWDFYIHNSDCDNTLNNDLSKKGLTGAEALKMPDWKNWQETYYKLTILAYPQDGGMMEILVDDKQVWKGATKLCSKPNTKATLWMRDDTSFIGGAQAHVKNIKYEYYWKVLNT